MKKLITILTIMIVLVGAVFADPTSVGSAGIDINATIEELVPTFKLRLTNNAAVDGAAESTVAAQLSKGDQDLSETSIGSLTLGNPVTVLFDIFQNTAARLSVDGTNDHDYTFTITATDLVLQEDGKGSAANEKFTVQQASPAINSLETAAATAANIQPVQNVTTATATGSAAGTGTLRVVYNGYVPASTILGNFGVTWNGNITAVPGDYKATITMAVTSI